MRWLLGICLLGSLSARAEGPHTLTLEAALELGRQNSTLIQASRANAEAATAKASESHAVLRPTFKLEANYGRLSEVDPFRVQLPGSPAPITISPVVLDNYSLRASVQQPLFTGFRLVSSAHAADRLADASEQEYRTTEADLVVNVTTAYWQLYQAFQKKGFVDENVLRLETDEHDTENLMKAGLATRNDLLRVQVQLSTARLAQIDAENDLKIAMMLLNTLVGLPLETDIELASVPGSHGERQREGISSQAGQARELKEKALRLRPDILAMQSRVLAAEEGVRAARGPWWPQIYLAGNYYYSRPNPRILPTRDEFMGTWDVGVQLRVDIWNWGATLFQTEQAEAGLKQARALLAQMEDNASLEVERSLLLLSRAKDKIALAQLAVQQAEESARQTSEKYHTGLATTADLIDGDVGLLQSRTTLTGALVEYEVAKAQLTRALGGPYQ
jgi:outer membrane protein